LIDVPSTARRLLSLSPFFTLILLLAACGLAGQFVADALGGAHIITERDCQQRQVAGEDVVADCCCTHPSFTPSTAPITLDQIRLAFGIKLAQPHFVSATLPPPFHPPV
jgi:hypothetical protein